ncbi:hypothetical protein [Leptothoe spongobia]|nr:hypothetical protein [Leptothoe spongobia]
MPTTDAEEHWVCVPKQYEDPIRRFKSFTGDLNALADWLTEAFV